MECFNEISQFRDDAVVCFLSPRPVLIYNLDYCFGSIDSQFGVDRDMVCASRWLINIVRKRLTRLLFIYYLNLLLAYMLK